MGKTSLRHFSLIIIYNIAVTIRLATEFRAGTGKKTNKILYILEQKNYRLLDLL
jgi:hypothetical protein